MPPGKGYKRPKKLKRRKKTAKATHTVRKGNVVHTRSIPTTSKAGDPQDSLDTVAKSRGIRVNTKTKAGRNVILGRLSKEGAIDDAKRKVRNAGPVDPKTKKSRTAPKLPRKSSGTVYRLGDSTSVPKPATKKERDRRRALKKLRALRATPDTRKRKR